MNLRTIPHLLGALTLALPLAHVSTAAAASGGDLNARYQAERSACANVPPESRQACLREAGAARQEISRGRLNNEVDAATQQRNAQQRCQAHTDPTERSLCERMALGEGNTRNSVQGGGVIRELEVQIPGTPVPVTPAPISPAPPVSPAPVYPAPMSPAPVSPAPTYPAPVTPAPVVPPPVAPAPVAPAPLDVPPPAPLPGTTQPQPAAPLSR